VADAILAAARLVINRGQSAPTFVYLTILILPSLLVIILPIAFFFGVLYSLSKLNSDSELVVMAPPASAAPSSRADVHRGGDGHGADLSVRPLSDAAGQRAMKDKVVDIRAEHRRRAAQRRHLQHPGQGPHRLHPRNRFDGSSAACWCTTTANKTRADHLSGAKRPDRADPAGARLIMVDGTVEQTAKGGARLSMLKFERYVFDLDQFASPATSPTAPPASVTVSELFWPDPSLGPRLRSAYSRSAQPASQTAALCIAFRADRAGRRHRGAARARAPMPCAWTIASVAATSIRNSRVARRGWPVGGRPASNPALLHAVLL